MTCDTVRDRLGEWLVGAMTGGEEEAVKSHVGTCAGCAGEVAALHDLEGRLRSLPGVPDAAPASAARSTLAWFGPAIAAVLFLGLVLVIFVLPPQAPIQVPAIPNPDTAVSPEPSISPIPTPTPTPTPTPSPSAVPVQVPWAELIRLYDISEKDGKPTVRFMTPFRDGTVVRLEILVLYTKAGHAIPGGPVGDIFNLEKVNIFLQSGRKIVHDERIKVDANGIAICELKKLVPGVYPVILTYSPMQQKGKVDPRFKKKIETEHAIVVYEPGFYKKALIDDAQELQSFGDRFHSTLKDLIVAKDQDIEGKMLPLIQEVRKRAATTYHPGVYGIMQDLSAFLHSNQKKLMGQDPDGPDFNAEMVDVKFKPMNLGATRESLAYALALAEVLVGEGERLSAQAAQDDIKARADGLVKTCADLQAVLAELPKADPTGQLGSKMGMFRILPLFTSMNEFALGVQEKRKLDPGPVQELKKRIREAMQKTADPDIWQLE